MTTWKLLPALWLVLAVGCQREGRTGVAASGSPSAAAAPAAATSNALPDRDPALAKRLVEQEHALLLDVRSQSEWDERHLDGAEHLPVDQLESRMSDVERLTGGDKSKAVVVYCKSGRRAAQAKQMLQAAGYQRVTNLGGIDDWPKD